MNEISVWLVPVLTIAGSIGGAFVGVKVAIARIEERVSAIKEDVAILRERSHTVANEVQTLIVITDSHEKRIMKLEA